MEDDIVINTDLGNLYLPAEKLKQFIIGLNQENAMKADIRQAAIDGYFGGEDYNTEFHNLNYYKVPSYLKCIWEVVKEEYHIDKITNYDAKTITEKPPKAYDFYIGLDEKENLLIDCVLFLRNKENDEKLILIMMPFNDGDKYYLDIESVYSTNGEGFRGFWERVKDYFKTQGPLKNELFDTKWNYVKFEKRNWDSIVLDKEYRKIIDRNIVKFLSKIEEYKDLGLPTSRGVLITGPPGTGKTLMCETIINQVDCTKIYVTSDSVDSVGDISQIYKVARKLSPSIVIIEDIDTLGGLDRRTEGNHPLLGEFLNCLNGVGNNEGVVTIATTNYPKHLDSALVDRPGRIDLRIEFGLPNEELRKHIFQKYLKGLKKEKINYSKIVKLTDGMTGAYIREIVMSAYMIAEERKSPITQNILEESIKNIVDMRNKMSNNKTYKESYHY